MSHVTFRLSHVTCYMSNAYVDPWDMLNNFCFHVYAQKWVFVIMSHVTFRMSDVKCLCWSLGHAEQLLFSCVSSKVSISNYVTCHILHVTCHIWNAYVDPWDMLNNFCFHVYAQMSLFMGENDHAFFYHHHHSTLACEWTNHRAGSQLKNVKMTTAGNQEMLLKCLNVRNVEM